MGSLPRFFVLESHQGRYLSVTENAPAIWSPGFQKFDPEQIVSPRVKFAVEQAETGDRRLVHIRSCYNNKYWVSTPLIRDLWITASADKPEEDQSKPSCTLFEPTFVGQIGDVRFRHVHTQLSALHSEDGYHGTQHGFELSSGSDSGLSDFRVVDWESLVILPSQVSFRSEDLNGSYLCSRVIEQYPYQRFESGLDVGDPLVAKELFITRNGNYRIKDGHFGKFWRRSPNWIWADTEANNNSSNTLFSIVKISDNVIAIRNLGNNNFCGAEFTTEGKTNYLNAQYPAISRQKRLVVEERVLSRDIFDVRYRLSDSRIYQEQIEEVGHSFATNDSTDRDSTVTLRFSIRDVRTNIWNHSVSVKLGVKTTFVAKAVPFILEGKIEVSTEFGYTHQWGETNTIECTRESGYAVVVPPLTTMKVTLMAAKAVCDVPFSYTQRDLLTNGETVTTLKDDGVYTGINAYNFYFQSSVVGKDNQGRIFI